MPSPDSRKIILPVFAGQGTTRASLRNAANQAIRDADSSAGSLLLSSCLDAFLGELAALSPEELDQSGICPSDFDDPRQLIIPNTKYAKNHIVTTTSLFLAQILRYHSYAQTTSSISHLLATNTEYGAGVLGLSSGIFPACVVAASYSPLSYVTTAVEVFRVVFWTSLRVLQFTRRLLKEKPVDPTLPWSVGCHGLTKTNVEEHIARFEQKYCHSRASSLCVTAILDENSVTVSGRPDLLVKFSTFVSQHCTVHPTTVDALYHSDLHFPDTRNTILEDLERRRIRFPDYQDLRCPLRSTLSGDIVVPSSDYPSLVALVLDLVLVHPVNWDLAAKSVAALVPANVDLWAINIGPGSGTLRALERAMPKHVHSVDATTDVRADAHGPGKQDPIAIVGMAAHAPGATNTAQLWDVLQKNINMISKIPGDRFQIPSRKETGEPGVETGNFMSDFASFDNKFFKISPREAKSMDPQQRILLHTAYEALESAGYVPDATPSFQRATFGCYVGAATQDYVDNLANNIDVHYSTGTLRAFMSGRISYAMKFGGPSVVIDTACSSSIIAIHQACRALMVGDCNAALAGGVNVITSPNMFVGLERGHFLSPTGQCKSFDASADGYSRGEGSCLFVLKRLSDAIAENDNIMGVIRGVEVNQSGLAHSITHPHSPTQAELLKTLLVHSGITPNRINVVEAHGTGTGAGDPCELASIRSVLCQGRQRDDPLHVTSIKANIGHLEAASGAVGLCKLLLMLRRNTIPAQISLKTLNPSIKPLEVDNTVIDTVPTPWLAKSTPRVAMLNNFGAAGSNGALILEEYITKKPHQLSESSSFAFGISAKTAKALESLRTRYMHWLSDPQNRDIPFSDVTYTATARRQIYPFRLSVSARDKDHLIRALDSCPVTQVERQEGKAIFVFPGQGSQYNGMGASLYATSAIFRESIDRCHQWLVSLGYRGILPVVSPGASEDAFAADEDLEVQHCAVLAVEFALSTLWKHLGVVPAAVIGHSLGEYAAMVTAGVLSIETALSIVAKRARLMSRACAVGKTGMMAVALSSKRAQEFLTHHVSFTNVTVACINTDSACVVSGPIEDLRTLGSALKREFSCKTAILKVPLGFHSSAMDPILDDLTEHVATLQIHPPTIPIASNIYGKVVPVEDSTTFQADYFARQCRQPVQFSQGLRELERYVDSSQIDAWIDVGPHAICVPMIEATLSSSTRLCLPSMLKDVEGWDTLMGSLAQLYRTAVPVDWRRVYNERTAGGCACVELPTYPFDSQTFLVPYVHPMVPGEGTLRSQVPGHSMLSSWSQYPSRENGNAAIFETPINTLAKCIDGHKVGGHGLCPASVYLEQALAGALITQRHLELDFGRSMPILRTIAFLRPLVFSREVPLIVRTHVTVHEDGTGSFSIASRSESSREEHVHVHGDLQFSSVRETKSNLELELPTVVRQVEALKVQEEIPEVFTTRTVYELVFPRVVEYSKDYHTVQSLTIHGNGTAGVARVVLTGTLDPQALFADTLLHVAGFILNMRCDTSDAYICTAVGLLKLVRDQVGDKQPCTVYCTNDYVPSRDVVTTDVLAVRSDTSTVVAQVRGIQFRRVKMTNLIRGLTLAADPSASKSRARTESNAIITPKSPRSIISERSRSNTKTMSEIHETDSEVERSGPPSSQTLVSESAEMPVKRVSSSAQVDRERVRQIVAEVLGVADASEIGDHVEFEALGLDSLGSIEAQQALKVALNKRLPHDLFIKCTTIAALCEFLAEGADKDEKKAPASSSVSSVKEDVSPVVDGREMQEAQHTPEVTLAAIQRCPGSVHAPLYLVHDGSGLVSHYERLLELHRDVWALANPHLFEETSWTTLEDMAHAYAQAIKQNANGAPVILGGWSFGGVVAYEIARRLVEQGVKIKGIVLIDSPAPLAPPLLSEALISRILGEGDRERSGDSSGSMMKLVMRQFKQNSALLGKYRPGAHARDGTGKLVPVAYLRCMAGYCPNGLKPEEVPAWFWKRDDYENKEGMVGRWGTLVGEPVVVWDVPGHHFEPFSGARTGETSKQLGLACEYLEVL